MASLLEKINKKIKNYMDYKLTLDVAVKNNQSAILEKYGIFHRLG